MNSFVPSARGTTDAYSLALLSRGVISYEMIPGLNDYVAVVAYINAVPCFHLPCLRICGDISFVPEELISSSASFNISLLPELLNRPTYLLPANILLNCVVLIPVVKVPFNLPVNIFYGLLQPLPLVGSVHGVDRFYLRAIHSDVMRFEETLILQEEIEFPEQGFHCIYVIFPEVSYCLEIRL